TAATVPFHAARDYVQGRLEQPGDGFEHSFSFGPFQLFPRQRRLLKDGKPIQIGCKALDILTVLAEHQGQVVSKKELLARVWSGVTVDEGALRVQMAGLRKVLGDGIGDAGYVKTSAGRGYCLVATAGQRESAAIAGVEWRADDALQLPLQL